MIFVSLREKKTKSLTNQKHPMKILFLKKRLNNILSQNTGKTIKTIEKDTNRDNFMSTQEAIAYGMIDEIVKKDSI